MSDDHRRKDNQEQARVNQASQHAGECLTSLQGDGVFPRQFLPVQGTLRTGW